MAQKTKGRAPRDAAQNKTVSPDCISYSLAARVRFGRWRNSRKDDRRRYKSLIVEAVDIGLMTPEAAIWLIDSMGLRHV